MLVKVPVEFIVEMEKSEEEILAIFVGELNGLCYAMEHLQGCKFISYSLGKPQRL